MRRRITRSYAIGSYIVVQYAHTPGLWSVLRSTGRRAIMEPFASLGAAMIAARNLSIASVLVVAALAFGATPAWADDAPPPAASFVSISSDAGRWSGYSARIQVTDSHAAAVWPGGYLSDGTFVQSGIIQLGQPTRSGIVLFAWATRAVDADPVNSTMPLAWTEIPTAKAGEWYTVELRRSGSAWTFRYLDPRGRWHTQGRFRSREVLRSYGLTVEVWPGGTVDRQVVTGLRALDGARWRYTTMTYGPPPEWCGVVSVTSPRPGTAVIGQDGSPCRLTRTLW